MKICPSTALLFSLTCAATGARAGTDLCSQLKQLKAAAASDFRPIASAPSLDEISWSTSLVLVGAKSLDCSILPADERAPALFSCRWPLSKGQDDKAKEEAEKLARAVHSCLGGEKTNDKKRVDARWSVFPDGKPKAGAAKLRIDVVANSGAARSAFLGTKWDGPASYELTARVAGPGE